MLIKEQFIKFIHNLQDAICLSLEACDWSTAFVEDKWDREGGGGGITRIIANGNVFEKGGVNTSVVHGTVTEAMRVQLKIDGDSWFACGISLVIHPRNPFVPTVHANYRMFELYDENGERIDRWFGGGTDLTPFYLIDEDAVHFHRTYKNICDKYDPVFYPLFKQNCDNYFVNTHRDNERRGIGGIFYDYKRGDEKHDESFWQKFACDCGYGFIDAYIPIVENRKDTEYDDNHKRWQDIRRGRYTEFNLVHDRGTLFGLKTGGRTESILMSLPPTVRFEYDFQPPPGSEEERLIQVCLYPKDWV